MLRCQSMRRTFSFAGYWLNNPPGANTNDWVGKRAVILKNGFGFLVLFNGHTISELKSLGNAAEAGKKDGQSAASLAQQEGFHSGTVIFLDQEEGGRMTDDQNAYILAWVDAVIAGGFRAGIYCSGMPAKEGRGQTIVTADDIRAHAGPRKISYFVYNDACPPAPGCVYPKNPPPPSASGVPYASVWQFAQSPRRHEFYEALRCHLQRRRQLLRARCETRFSESGSKLIALARSIERTQMTAERSPIRSRSRQHRESVSCAAQWIVRSAQ